MKIIKLFMLALVLSIYCGTTFAQQESEEFINYKELSYQDALRIFGPLSGKKFQKPNGLESELKDIRIKGNKIATILYNHGSVCAPSVLNDVDDLVWEGLGYGYEFGTLAGAEVIDADGNPLHIISDSHIRSSEGDYNSDGTLKWGWLPRPGFSDPFQNRVASLNAEDSDGDGKPDSWPDEWYSAGAGKYLWPAFLGDMSTAPDEEVYYGIDDYTNYEFQGRYDPFPSDLEKGGLGLQSLVRILQFNNPLAEDIIFMIYQMTNTSEKNLDKLYMGMFGDPHVGGGSDYSDDKAFFIPPKGDLAESYDQRARSMVYAWDDDFKGHGGKRPGYFGWKFLESPSIADDIFDNDDDGIIDETPFNSKGQFIDGEIVDINTGIAAEDIEKYTEVYGKPQPRWSGDEDGDWDIEKHDVGIDGIGPESVNYPGKDYGEGDGFPTQAWFNDDNGNGQFDSEESGSLTEEWSNGLKWAGSEPNFGFRDVSESDQLGLTGFTAAQFGSPNIPKNDELLWGWFVKHEERTPEEPIDPEQPLLKGKGDNVFCFSTGPLALARGESQRFSMAIIMGEDILDLRLNAITSVRILEADYRFAQPPSKPMVTAASGDGKVTLYWDAKSEKSIDPLTGEEDFEGYKIYRSRDFNFSDVYKITDANGVPFLGQALVDPQTGAAAQFDLDNEYAGLAEREYDGRGIRYELGNNTGLVHQYVDSSVTNGVNYYYAVVAYDRGSPELPPTETQAVIQKDPLTGELIYDVNTLTITPGPIAKGLSNAQAGIDGEPLHTKGDATGSIKIEVLEDLAVDNKTYKIKFETVDEVSNFSVLDSTGVSYTFVSKDTVLVALRHLNIVASSIEVFDAGDNKIAASKYAVNTLRGRIAGSSNGSLPEGEVFTIKYRYYPVYKSEKFNDVTYDPNTDEILEFVENDGNNAFDGMRVFITNDRLSINKEDSKFIVGEPTVNGRLFYPGIFVTNKVKLRNDFEIRWNNLDKDADGKWLHANTITTLLGEFNCPFTIVNPATEEEATFVVWEETNPNKQWDWGEAIIFQPFGATDATTSYQLNLSIDSTASEVVLPKQGDVYLLKTNKPFNNDEYTFDSKSVVLEKESVAESLNDVYVVPNPYVGYSESENPGRTLTKRGDRELQFRNLPQQCKIRIYTITGELVDTIEKDDNTSMASWNLLSKEGMRIAYGVYIFHVKSEDGKEKIGRFAVIK
ncbi:MAG: hypothetical protein JEY94_04050 [Melioribacteraceae bacterium]|nr:hypothetical protein [Melioribacteraceae bacterium]